MSRMDNWSERGQEFLPQSGQESNLSFSIEQLWRIAKFSPDENQKQAILHTVGPLYLPAGPGSGKTRVLLWRTLNLIVFHGVHPEAIFLSTFTEKAALQLKEGLRVLLGMVTNLTGAPYDLSQMYVGTVHSLCQRLLADRRFYPHRQRGKVPVLLDDLDQYFHLSNRRRWNELTKVAELGDAPEQSINSLFSGKASPSKYLAVTNCLQLFNRLSEEGRDPHWAKQRTQDPRLQTLLEMYAQYRQSLEGNGTIAQTDFALLQQKASLLLLEFAGAGDVFKHVIIDEYQDTNTIQEQIFFQLSAGHKNICVVGDDDQALYRFRGATVENFVEFPQRCRSYLNVPPRTIPLNTNYRSRRGIVSFYTRFMSLCDWQKNGDPSQSYRVTNKNIHAASNDDRTAVISSTPAEPLEVCQEIALLVRRLLDERKVENANQIAFLYPSLKYNGAMTDQVRRMKEALEAQGLKVYAPRASRFLEVDEAVALFGLYLHIFGKPDRGQYSGVDYNAFQDWLSSAQQTAKELMEHDAQLASFVQHRRANIEGVMADFEALSYVVKQHQWDLQAPYDIAVMKRPLYEAPKLSEQARRALSSQYFERLIQKRREEGKPVTLQYIINRATSLDWNVLDLFYQLCGFEHFKRMFDLAESGEDEGHICNLGLISQYLARFIDQYSAIITASLLQNGGLQKLFFGLYLYTLFRRGEAEYEDADDPFPKGRIPFITIHQSKGLEFPVVILGNPRKENRGPQAVEKLVHPLLEREGEPLERMPEFDTMRMFYVALSRAKNLLVIAHFKGRGQRMNPPFQALLGERFPKIPEFDLSTLPEAKLDDKELPKNYSYTGDFLLYKKCPRQYMILRKYGFVPSRSQTMMFGNLVHKTLDDLHQYLIWLRSQAKNETSR